MHDTSNSHWRLPRGQKIHLHKWDALSLDLMAKSAAPVSMDYHERLMTTYQSAIPDQKSTIGSSTVSAMQYTTQRVLEFLLAVALSMLLLLLASSHVVLTVLGLSSRVGSAGWCKSLLTLILMPKNGGKNPPTEY